MGTRTLVIIILSWPLCSNLPTLEGRGLSIFRVMEDPGHQRGKSVCQSRASVRDVGVRNKISLWWWNWGEKNRKAQNYRTWFNCLHFWEAFTDSSPIENWRASLWAPVAPWTCPIITPIHLLYFLVCLSTFRCTNILPFGPLAHEEAPSQALQCQA